MNTKDKELPFVKSAAINTAIKEYLSNNPTIKKIETQEERKRLFDQAIVFEKNNVFSYARRLFQLLYNHGERSIALIEKLAVCTYKDTDLASDFKYKAAATLLTDYLNENKDKFEIGHANLYGILGSIYKKRWQYENHNNHLHQSLNYYIKGYNLADDNKEHSNPGILGKAISHLGFCGINIAFIYDQLAKINALDADLADSSLSQKFTVEADKARDELIEINRQYEPIFEQTWNNPDKENTYDFSTIQKYWFYVTLAEAYLGKKQFEKSKAYYKLSISLGEIDLWARQTATIQGLNLLELHYDNDDPKLEEGKEILKTLVGKKSTSQLHSKKIGLALSGGGFRASLFHIGVLAQLAQAGILHKVEVISCVSGGSIIGAYYYLKLKKLLEKSGKSKLDENDYINLVEEMHKDFLESVNKNVRLRIFENLWYNVKMAVKGNFSRTTNTSRLYSKHFYNGLLNSKHDLKMRDLKIQPKDPSASPEKNKENEDFNPVFDNWEREYKVPELILNATTLNTGHSWQFTATWMGESPAYINSEFNALPTLRRVYYTEEEAGKYKDISLSTAVAASAGVPGVFAPVELKNLYKEYPKVLLVDGGVHDNQGITSLYERECNLLIISDASGQMPEKENPKNNVLNVYSRTTNILQDRIRQVQFSELESRKKAGLIRDYLLVHFTKDLKGGTVDYENCKEKLVLPKFEKAIRKDGQTNYEINISLQKALARIRTDLDAFHQSEAYGLMYSGYKMTEKEIQKTQENKFKNVTGQAPQAGKWNFLPFGKFQDINSADKMESILKPSSQLIGKFFLFFRSIKYLKWGLLIFPFTLLYLFVISPASNEWLILLKNSRIFKLAPYFIVFILLICMEQIALQRSKMRGILGPIFLLIVGLIASPIFFIWRILTKFYLNKGKLPKP